MADKKKEGSKAYSMLPGKSIFIASMICLAIGIYQVWPGNPVAKAVEVVKEIKPSSAPSVAPAKPSAPCEAVKPKEPTIIKVELDPVEWSEWITIPENSRFRICRPGCWEEYWFWDGRKILAKPQDKIWFGDDIRDCNFKLRGTKRLAEIVITPK